MSNKIVIKDALLLDPAVAGPARRGDVVIENGAIAAITEPNAADLTNARTIDGRERLLLPGLINSHTHSPTNVLKGTGDILSHPAFMWRNQADTAGRTPDEIRLSALLGCIEHLLGGTTAILDHFPEQGFSDADVDAVVDAYRVAGIRALVALRIFDEPYTDIEPPGGYPEGFSIENPLVPPSLDESIALVETAIARHHKIADGRIEICPAPSNPMRCSDELLSLVVDLAKRHDTAIHMHLLETAVQAKIARDKYGRSMVAQLDRLGVLNERLSTAHTIWLDDADIELFAERRAMPVHNPESNLKLGTGLSPVAKMLRAGVIVALGSDGASTNDNLDMHEVMRLALMLQRPGELDRRRWPTASQGLAMATVSGGKVLRRPGLGTLAVGAPADLVLHDLTAPSWVPLNDPLAQIVFGASGATVDTVIVDGRVVVENGKITAFDMQPVLDEVRDLVRRQRARNSGLQGWAARMEELVP
ncbi:amidohydrolase family protein [Rhodoplanes sp. Z2-YC6860]|uniref:amidohydrolase family protein n=1 Tax=Rhodoplanes sp. Z2-YC6860 TaxID=674703 RepID=UPI00078C77E3|nr:amidohydrolase [Rhodoplanes sp. Z2-YC6860]AMN41120.1 cytosine deaminase-like metal-dependent hydrolase [Rhodoplanes sp. Z2-YC6860]